MGLIISRLVEAVALALTTTAFAAAPPTAEESLPGEERTIIVTGERDMDDAVRAYVEGITVETGDQIAKFAVPACPLALGLLPEQNAFIVERLRLIADYLGIGSGGRGCDANIVVVAAGGGDEFLQRLHAERPDLFTGFEAIDIRRIMQLQGPARAWHVTELRGADGRPTNWIEVGKERRLRPSLANVMPSLTSRPTRQDLTLVFVVLDLDALDGLSPLQIADHAAMRAFARTRTATLPGGRSILTLFADRASGATPAQELTEWDTAYLTGLYRTANLVSARQQQASVAGFMRRELDRGQTGPD